MSIDIANPGADRAAVQAAIAAYAPCLLLAAGPSAPIYGGSGAGFVTAHSVDLPANAIVGGSMLRLRLLLSKYAPNNAGHSWQLVVIQGGYTGVMAQNSVGAGIASLLTETEIHVAYDRKSAVAFSVNTLEQSTIAAGQVAATGAKTSNVSFIGARAPGNIMFVSNSAPPTIETKLIDFTQPLTIALQVRPQGGDTVEVPGVSLEMVGGGVNYSPTRATAIWSDSLGEGTGSTNEAVTNYPMNIASQLRRQRQGWPIAGKGLGGQKSAAIIDRMLADPIEGKLWNAILWIGTNDFDDNVGNGPGWFAAIKAQIDRAIAFRGGTQRLIINNMYPRASWIVGDANYVAMQYVNTQLAATYGPAVCDIFTALATNAGKVPGASMSDDVHLTNAGYTTVMQTVDAKMTALNWT